jgi:hypothetical protein
MDQSKTIEVKRSMNLAQLHFHPAGHSLAEFLFSLKKQFIHNRLDLCLNDDRQLTDLFAYKSYRQLVSAGYAFVKKGKSKKGPAAADAGSVCKLIADFLRKKFACDSLDEHPWSPCPGGSWAWSPSESKWEFTPPQSPPAEAQGVLRPSASDMVLGRGSGGTKHDVRT